MEAGSKQGEKGDWRKANREKRRSSMIGGWKKGKLGRSSEAGNRGRKKWTESKAGKQRTKG